MRTIKRAVISTAFLALMAGLPGAALAADPAAIDWSKIRTKTVTLFYPGQSTYQWLRSRDHKRAYKKVLKGDSCVSCHEEEEADMGNLIVAGKRLEPAPIPGKNGTIELAVQAAHDDDYLYWRFRWKSNMDREGRMHDYMMFDGKTWTFYGSHRAKDAVREGRQPPLYEDRLAIMVDDGSVPLFAQQGCWLSCHDSMRDMPNAPATAAVKGHAYLGKTLNKKDIRKFLPSSRTDGNAGWDTVKMPGEIAKIKAAGGFLDLMQWRVHRSNPVGMADDGYVLAYRLFDAGKKMFSWNVDKKTMTPKYMFDPAKVGFKALREGDIGDAGKPMAVIRGINAVAYDPDAGWKEGDILPGRLLSTRTEGSAGDNDWAKGVWKDGAYTLVFRRKLDTGHPEDDKVLKVGGVYTVGFAVHDDNVTTRFHHVGFPLSMGIGVKADIQATTLK